MSRRDRIRLKLEEAFQPLALEVEDDSARHAGHAGARGGESHFNVRLVSARFSGMSRVARHRAVTKALESEFAEGLHALQLTALTPSEG